MLLPASGIITLYHGTTLFFADVLRGNGVWLSIQRRSTDFGQGFYVTQDYSQAGKWACFRIAYGIPAPHPSFLSKLGVTWEQYQRDKRTDQLSLNTEQVLDRLSKPIRMVRVKCPI